MATFKNLIEVPIVLGDKRAKPNKLKKDERGCDYCPLNKVKGIKKIFGTVTGKKKFFIGAQSPGGEENKAGKELIGPSGKFLWKELSRVGITREMCDIQNAVKCLPADREDDGYLSMRTPTDKEIHCCSIYTEEALKKSHSRVYLLFGQIAHKQFLAEEYKKGKTVFYSSKLHARVICLDHPAYFIRHASQSRLEQFRRLLELAARLGKIKRGKFSYIKEQDYVGITTRKAARKAYKEILAWARNGERISADLEEGSVDKNGNPSTKEGARRVPLAYGFCGKPGHSRVFALEHPDANISSDDKKFINNKVRKLLRNRRIQKICHHGSYDIPATRSLLGYEVRGYDYDTNYAEYFRHPEQRSFALPAIAEHRFPEFVGYKEIILPETMTPKFRKYCEEHKIKDPTAIYKLARKKNGLNYAQLPWEKMILYNGADNDLQKRIEVTTRKIISLPLLKVYMDAAFVMDKMEKNGPLFDYKHCEKLKELWPVRRDKLLTRIRKIADDKEFNPGSPKQVNDIIYKKLHLEFPGKGKPNTQKETMVMLAAQHKLPKMIIDWRKDDKACSTYIQGFENCANYNHGRLRTIWWLTGTATGRRRSGGGDEGEDGVINLQNIHGDPQLQNLLVSDVAWRDIYTYWRHHGDFTEKTWRAFSEFYIFLGFDQAQFELRVLAQRSGDKELIIIFNSGEDIHASVGHALTGRSIQDIKNDDRLRREIKGCQFGIVYGLKGPGLVSYLWTKFGVKMSLEKVNEFMDRYFRRFKAVARMIERDHEFAQENKYVETMFGFRRYLNMDEQERGEEKEGPYWANVSVNTPIQGTAGQMMLMSLVPIVRQPEKYKLLSNPQLEIHDALYFRVKLKYLWEAIELGRQMMEKEPVKIARNEFNIDWNVPLKAEAKAGFRFGTMLKDINSKMGTAEFLNSWCAKNQKMQKAMQLEMKKLSN